METLHTALKAITQPPTAFNKNVLTEAPADTVLAIPHAEGTGIRNSEQALYDALTALGTLVLSGACDKSDLKPLINTVDEELAAIAMLRTCMDCQAYFMPDGDRCELAAVR